MAEEFVVSPEFAAWFLAKTKFTGIEATVVDVSVSKSDNTGESDLVVVYQDLSGPAKYALHIEDKIDAPIQPDQEQRYRQRAEQELYKGDYQDYDLVLCAPTFYHQNQTGASGFDRYVSYEDIADFIARNDWSPRGKYRSEFVATATSKKINSWQKVDDQATNRFWEEAYRIASQEFTILEMKAPNLTKDSTWINFRPHDMPTMPRRVYISFKGDKGYMDLTLERCSSHQLEAQVRPFLASDMTVHQTSRSAAIRLNVSSFSVSEPLAKSLPAVREAFAACTRLIQFYRANRYELDSAAAASNLTK